MLSYPRLIAEEIMKPLEGGCRIEIMLRFTTARGLLGNWLIPHDLALKKTLTYMFQGKDHMSATENNDSNVGISSLMNPAGKAMEKTQEDVGFPKMDALR